ncbi:hypothetical protein GCM10010335_67670 [Streptomyces galbus]|nr:hypothetical protein GCM10010335_67670 [Streptomyces galbus]
MERLARPAHLHTGMWVLLRSRQGTDMNGSFSEIRTAAATLLDGELSCGSAAAACSSGSSSVWPGAAVAR